MIENIKYYKNRDREKEKNNTKERKTLKATPLFSVVIEYRSNVHIYS